MKIAILGTRGIPNRYGGFEAFAEQLSARLAERGHEVSVYCRRPYTRPGDEQLVHPHVRRVILPSIATKHLDTAINTFISAVHVAFTDAEAVLMCNVGNSAVAWIPRLFGKPVVLNVDGLDRQRRKWGWLARTYLHFNEWLSTFTPSRIVTDARAIQDYYRQRYRRESTMIGYGAAVPADSNRGDSVLQRFNLQSRRYILYVSRLEPENHPDLVIRAYHRLKIDWPLVMVGDSRYDPAYAERLRAQSAPGVIFAGAIYGPGYWELQRHAGLFVFACEVGGIHPALIETMAAGNASLYLDTASNRETAGDCGVVFYLDERDLAEKLDALVKDSARRAQLGAAARLRAQQLYNWDEITRQYEALLAEVRP
jgi:glycosyltransferase involved in cell wall biosynthesis